MRLSALLVSIHSASSSKASHALRGRQQFHPNLSIARTQQNPERRIQSLSSFMSDFTTECTSFLLSPDSVADGIISQTEFSKFLFMRCRSDGLCGAEEEVDFEQLGLNLQLTFVRGVCPYSDVMERISCIQALERMWLDNGFFGYEVGNNQDLNEHVEDMCTNSYGDAVEMGLIMSPTPTLNPSRIETEEPSSDTTNVPTTSPLLDSSSGMPTFPNRNYAPTLDPTPFIVSTQMPSIEMKATNTFDTTSPTFQPNLFNGLGKFEEECKGVLLSPSVLDDGIVSQIEFTSFLNDRCKAEGLCEGQSKIAFEHLDVEFQLDFILGACLGDTEDCVDDLKAAWYNGTHFGYDVGNEDIEKMIDILCYSAFEYAHSNGLAATSVPTKDPSDIQVEPPSNGVDLSSYMPSSQEKEEAIPTEKKPLGPRAYLIGVSAMLVFLFVTASGVLVYRKSDYVIKTNVPDEYYSKEANYYGAEPLAVPFPFYISSSCSSSSSSFRDYRFKPVFVDGKSIVQFDPNQAGAVVIGSVTIGRGGSSSISTGPFTEKDECSPSRPYIMIGRVSNAKSEVNSGNSSSELSSMSSDRSTGASHTSKGPTSDLVSTGRSISRFTVPIRNNGTEFERHLVCDKGISFADWKAASYMISECRNPQQVTDSAAAKRQRDFFFNLYSSQYSDESSAPNHATSSHSYGDVPRFNQSDFSSDMILPPSNQHGEGNDSINHETPTEFLVPWRRGGFTFQPSDGKQSEDSARSSRSAYMEPWGNGIMFSSKPRFVHPVQSVLNRVKCVINGWLKHKQYKHLLNERLQEDRSVISMAKSCSSNLQLLPATENATFGLPPGILGTWAAASSTIPLENNRMHSLGGIGAGINGELGSEKQPDMHQVYAPRDSENSSGFESSTGWSSSVLQSSFISSSSSTSNNNNSTRLVVSSTTDAVKDILIKNESLDQSLNYKTDVSHIISEDHSTHESPVEAKTIKAGESGLDIVGSIMDDHRIESLHPSQFYSRVSQKGGLFFMALADGIYTETSSGENSIPKTDNGDWSNVSDSAYTVDGGIESLARSTSAISAHTDDYAHSLSFSLESEADSASQALDWAITRETLKK